MRRSFLRGAALVAALSVAAIVAETPSPAASVRDVESFQTNPIPIGHGYKLSISSQSIFRFGPFWIVNVVASRQVGRVADSQTWQFKLPRSGVTFHDRVGGIRIASGSALGPFGTIDVRAVAVGPEHVLSRPCSAHEGPNYGVDVVLKGTIRFATGTPLGTVHFRTLRAQAVTSGHQSCTVFSHDPCLPGAELISLDSPTTLHVRRWSDGTGYAQMQEVSFGAKPATIYRTAMTTGMPARALAVAADLSWGRFDASWAGPGLTGRFTTTATDAPVKVTTCNGHAINARLGPGTGTVTASLGVLGSLVVTDMRGQVQRY